MTSAVLQGSVFLSGVAIQTPREPSCTTSYAVSRKPFLQGEHLHKLRSHGVRNVPCKDRRISASASVPNTSSSSAAAPSATRLEDPVLVLGATGGVGQIVTSALLDRGYKVRAVLRNVEKGRACFGDSHKDQLQMHVGDTRFADTLTPELMEGVKSVICCTGTTAFPSKRWDGGNKPEAIDYHGLKNLVAALPKSVKRVVLVSSVGCDSYNSFPYNILNLFGVLKYKKMGEDHLKASGLPYTIIRAGRLTDGPYTSYDINTLLKATSGTRRAVIVSQGDKLRGECSRISVAEASIQALALPCTEGQTYELNSVEGEGPDSDSEKWEVLFTSAHHHR